MISRRWFLSAFVVVFMAGSLIFVASKKDYVFRFSESQLQEKLNARIPWSQSYLFIFDVTLDNPRVDLIDGSDRVAGGIDVLLNIKIGDSAAPLRGAVDLSGDVEYRSEEGAFYLTDPVIEALRIAGVPERYSDRTHHVISLALAEYFKTRPIYSLEGTDASKVAARLLLKDVMVKDEHLIVTLGVQKKQELYKK